MHGQLPAAATISAAAAAAAAGRCLCPEPTQKTEVAREKDKKSAKRVLGLASSNENRLEGWTGRSVGGYGRLTADDASHLPAAAAAAVTSANSATYAATKQTASATKTHRQLHLMHKPNKHRQLLLQRGLVHPALRGWGSSRCCGCCFRCYRYCCSGLQHPKKK